VQECPNANLPEPFSVLACCTEFENGTVTVHYQPQNTEGFFLVEHLEEKHFIALCLKQLKLLAKRLPIA
jgi:hypothetical protein